VKIDIGGEKLDLDFDLEHVKMADALAIERAWGRRYAEWEVEFLSGSAEALCVFVWLAWHRNGREVDLKDILSGDVDFDYSQAAVSIIGAVREARDEALAARENPTIPAAPLTAPAGTATTRRATKGSSASS
jgi:hypothetical protein